MAYDDETAVAIRRAASSLSAATAMLFVSGPALSVDSGLSWLEGDEALWSEFPKLRGKVTLAALSRADIFRKDPATAWGFYGTRLRACRLARPHTGYEAVLSWTETMRDGAFVRTTAQDGQFVRAMFPFSRLVEEAGALEWLRCTKRCGREPFPGGMFDVDIDPETQRAEPPFPSCPDCGALARPNVPMWNERRAPNGRVLKGGYSWDRDRFHAQDNRMDEWLSEVRAQKDRRFIVVACSADREGLGRADRTSLALGGALVCIEPRDIAAPRGSIRIKLSPREGLEAIDAALCALGWGAPGHLAGAVPVEIAIGGQG